VILPLSDDSPKPRLEVNDLGESTNPSPRLEVVLVLLDERLKQGGDTILCTARASVSAVLAMVVRRWLLRARWRVGGGRDRLYLSPPLQHHRSRKRTQL
jgi:hypothetical protein